MRRFAILGCVLVLIFFILIAVGKTSTPPPKWKKVGGLITNKTADSVGIVCGSNTFYIASSDTLVSIVGAEGTLFAIDSVGTVYFKNYRFPLADGSNGQYIATNGSGALTWTTPGGGSGFWNEVDSLLYWDGGNSVGSDSSAIFDVQDDGVHIRTDLPSIYLEGANGLNYADSFVIGKLYLVYNDGADTIVFDTSDTPVDGYALTYNSVTGTIDFQAVIADTSNFTLGLRRVGGAYSFAAGQIVLDTINNRLRASEDIATSHYFNNTTSNNAQFLDASGDNVTGILDFGFVVIEFGAKDSLWFDTTGATDTTGAFKFTDDIHSLYGDDSTGGNVSAEANILIRMNNTTNAQARLYFGENGSNVNNYLQYDPSSDEFTLTDELNAPSVDTDTIFLGNDTLIQDHIPAYLVRTIVRNGTGDPLGKGAPVYLVGTAVAGFPNVDSAASNSASTMPCIGILEHDIGNGQTGYALSAGEVTEFDTQTPGWAIGDELYVAPTGGLTATKPTGDDFIQKVGVVTRVSTTVGAIEVVGAGRVNAIPNLTTGYAWVGNGDSVGTETDIVTQTEGDATYEVQLNNEAGLYSVLSDVSNFLQITDTGFVANGNQGVVTGNNVYDFILGQSYAASDGDTYTGVHDFGGATSLEVPNSSNPTTDTYGELAQDTNNVALEIYDGSTSRLIPTVYPIGFTIPSPDGLADTITIFHCGDLIYPGGIKLLRVELIANDSAGTYAIQFEEWTGKQNRTRSAYIDTITVQNDSSYARSETFTDSDIAAENDIRVIVPSTATDEIKGTIYFYIKESN